MGPEILQSVFMDLGKLNFPMVVSFRLKPIFNTAPAASKNTARFKSGQNQPKNNHLSSLIEIRDTLCIKKLKIL